MYHPYHPPPYHPQQQQQQPQPQQQQPQQMLYHQVQLHPPPHQEHQQYPMHPSINITDPSSPHYPSGNPSYPIHQHAPPYHQQMLPPQRHHPSNQQHLLVHQPHQQHQLVPHPVQHLPNNHLVQIHHPQRINQPYHPHINPTHPSFRSPSQSPRASISFPSQFASHQDQFLNTLHDRQPPAPSYSHPIQPSPSAASPSFSSSLPTPPSGRTPSHPSMPPSTHSLATPSQPTAGQHTQTDQHVSTILSLPPSVLAKLARTSEKNEQEQILNESRLDPQILPIMSLSAPEPPSDQLRDRLSTSFAGPTSPASLFPSSLIHSPTQSDATTPLQLSITQSISHLTIPHILHQVFSPNSTSILAPVTELSSSIHHSHEYQPSYRSVDEWAMQVAQQTAAISPIDPQATQYIATQLKQWALHSQDSQLEQHVQESKKKAVLLAAKAEAVRQSSQCNPAALSQINQSDFNSDDFFPDLTPYANTYKSQLATIASGYYTRLHKHAINTLNNTHPSTPSASAAPGSSAATNTNPPAPAETTRASGSCSATALHSPLGPNHDDIGHIHHDLNLEVDRITIQPNHLHTYPLTSISSLSSNIINIGSTTAHNQQHIGLPISTTPTHPVQSGDHSDPAPFPPSDHHSTLLPSSAPAPSPSTSSNSVSAGTPHHTSPALPHGSTHPTPSMNMLTNTLGTHHTTPCSKTHSSLEKLSSKNVQAAAVAALTANVMAATDLASRAGQTLSTLGMNVETKLTTPLPPPGPSAIAATQHSLALAHQQQQQHINSPSASSVAPMTNHLMPNPTPPHSYPRNPPTQRPPNSLPGSFRSTHPSTAPIGACSPPASNHPHLPNSSGPVATTSNEPLNSHASQVEKMWRSAQEGQCTERARDYLLSYAHAVYSKKPNDPCLLPLLHTLIKLHPKHLPTLLLLSCVYYSQGDYVSSLFHNNQILLLDPEYVEAMSNLGTTQRALGKWAEAEEWWWKAIKLRPTYFDAFDNLLGVLCNPQSPSHSQMVHSAQLPSTQPRYSEALRLCTFVETSLFGSLDQQVRPIRLPASIPPSHVHRVQNLFYAKGNLLIASGKPNEARHEYEKALEVVLGPPTRKTTSTTANASSGYALVDLVLAVTSIGIFMMALNGSQSGSIGDPMVLKALSATGIWDPNQCSYQAILSDPLRAAQQRRQFMKAKLLQLGGGILPCVLLLPESLDQLIATVLNASHRVLPVFKHHVPSQATGETIRHSAFQSANQTTSTLLLTLAKCLQDAISAPMGTGEIDTSLDGIPPSPSLLLSLYYVAITLHQSPSTCNNLGILLSTIPSTLTINTPAQGRRVINGQQIAHTFYVQGLQKDRNHPHLYTNLGSLLKDMGQLPQAVSMYEKAVQCNPNFDVALANLANAIKDMGRVQESVQWYLRAASINPNFPEAVCGLVNALGGVCDWRDRGAVGNEPVVDRHGKLLGPPTPAADGKLRAGLMGKVSILVDKQLDEGMSYGKGVIKQTANLENWVEAISIVKTGRSDGLSEEEKELWSSKFQPFCESSSNSNSSHRYNEGGFLIRMIERFNRQIQRRWYVDSYGQVVQQTTGKPRKIEISADGASSSNYCRLTLPTALPMPPVPTVLPFHTFTYPLTARECRLISHRNALRISHITLNQPWIPASVYPPPPPPCPDEDEDLDEPGLPRLRVGYVSSDFNNHPLAHLMQSVFGIHNRAKFSVVCYATSASDGSIYRKKIEQEVETFKDVSSLSHEDVIKEIVKDGIHILINLNGYTKGAKNEIFAARPSPVQIEFMGFAGTLASGWTDWIIADPVVCPPRMISGEKWRRRHQLSKLESFSTFGSTDGQTESIQSDSRPDEPKIAELVDDGLTDFDGDLDPEDLDESWVYTEKFIYMPHSYFVCDHKQGFREQLEMDINGGVDSDGIPLNFKREQLNKHPVQPLTGQPVLSAQELEWQAEEVKRWKMRKNIFPDLDDQTVIFANFNQLYKIDPLIFKYWLEILMAVPNSILWLLRFPAPGEPHLKVTAERWAGKEVAARIRFTDVAPKPLHIQRGRIADLFLDSTECNAHTTAADILWSGTPILTLPRPTHAHKMCSRVAASIALATGYGASMIAKSMEDYKNRAIEFAMSVRYVPRRTESGIDYMSGEMRENGLIELRHRLYFNREHSALFDTARWTRNLEKGLWEAWSRYVKGLDCEENQEWKISSDDKLKGSCSIWIDDDLDHDDDDDSKNNQDLLRARLDRTRFIREEHHTDHASSS